MEQKNELRVFHNYFELDRDYKDFINSSICHSHKLRERTAESGEWKIRWVEAEYANGPHSRIAGMNFERIQCDMRVAWEIQRFILTRLRSRHHAIEPLMSFYEYPWDMEYGL